MADSMSWFGGGGQDPNRRRNQAITDEVLNETASKLSDKAGAFASGFMSSGGGSVMGGVGGAEGGIGGAGAGAGAAAGAAEDASLAANAAPAAEGTFNGTPPPETVGPPSGSGSGFSALAQMAQQMGASPEAAKNIQLITNLLGLRGDKSKAYRNLGRIAGYIYGS